ncbi:MAG: hypothetical protein ACXWIW_06730 [Croceibacterium sp.]
MANSPLDGGSHGRNTHTDAGLDLFAAAWLERWQSFGGTVFVDRDSGAASLIMPEPGIGGRPELEGEGRLRDWNDGYGTGRWRELEDLLLLVPGGRAAVAVHVVRYPSWTGERELGA